MYEVGGWGGFVEYMKLGINVLFSSFDLGLDTGYLFCMG